MAVFVRLLRADEARLFLGIQRKSVRGVAAKDYPNAVIDAWAPLPITDEMISRFLRNRDREIRWMAEIDGEPVGIGALVLSEAELRACYVLPHAARRGIGTALVAEIERTAREHGLTYLRVTSSVTAEAFYSALGYVVGERGELVLRSGIAMAAVTMRKELK